MANALKKHGSTRSFQRILLILGEGGTGCSRIRSLLKCAIFAVIWESWVAEYKEPVPIKAVICNTIASEIRRAAHASNWFLAFVKTNHRVWDALELDELSRHGNQRGKQDHLNDHRCLDTPVAWNLP
ncbi:hypothetical protein SADUNF_Sadunf06G0053900 [Salix dunnii]|uniref:Uncharacterized protein n=1 Tax=Salix dunnii TaxID=1413687 RepID=A0A835K5L8_9ROSI|nr:hypothetical protein SADUNF_Sadunf06G0053900 [Salix dunnii]